MKTTILRNLYDTDQSKELFGILAFALWHALSAGERETLACLVKEGPLFDGNVPSKVARDSLLEMELASKVYVRGEEGYQAANYMGGQVYRCGQP